MITDCDDSWLGVDDAAVVVLDLVHAVDDVPLRAVEAARTDDVHLQCGIFRLDSSQHLTQSVITPTYIEMSTGNFTMPGKSHY